MKVREDDSIDLMTNVGDNFELLMKHSAPTSMKSDTFGQFVINILDFFKYQGQQLKTLDQGSTDRQVRVTTGPNWSEIFKNLLVLDFSNFSGRGPVVD